MKVTEAALKGFIRLRRTVSNRTGMKETAATSSYRIKTGRRESVKEELTDTNYYNDRKPAFRKPAGEYFVTGSENTSAMGSLIWYNAASSRWMRRERTTICWAWVNGDAQTKGFPSHLMNHEVKKEVTNGKHRVIYHAHPTNGSPPDSFFRWEDKVFTRELWKWLPSAPVVLPDGVGVVGRMVPADDIAVAISELMKSTTLPYGSPFLPVCLPAKLLD